MTTVTTTTTTLVLNNRAGGHERVNKYNLNYNKSQKEDWCSNDEYICNITNNSINNDPYWHKNNEENNNKNYYNCDKNNFSRVENKGNNNDAFKNSTTEKNSYYDNDKNKFLGGTRSWKENQCPSKKGCDQMEAAEQCPLVPKHLTE